VSPSSRAKIRSAASVPSRVASCAITVIAEIAGQPALCQSKAIKATPAPAKIMKRADGTERYGRTGS
jgi:hypothetical protein